MALKRKGVRALLIKSSVFDKHIFKVGSKPVSATLIPQRIFKFAKVP